MTVIISNEFGPVELFLAPFLPIFRDTTIYGFALNYDIYNHFYQKLINPRLQ
jgi:hypothetical protein